MRIDSKAVLFALALFSAALCVAPSICAGERLKLSSTTSTDNTGLLSFVLPIFEQKYGMEVLHDIAAQPQLEALRTLLGPPVRLR